MFLDCHTEAVPGVPLHDAIEEPRQALHHGLHLFWNISAVSATSARDEQVGLRVAIRPERVISMMLLENPTSLAAVWRQKVLGCLGCIVQLIQR